MAVKVPKEEEAIRKAVHEVLNKLQLRYKKRLVDPETAAQQIIKNLNHECVVRVCGGAVPYSYTYAATTTMLTAVILEDVVWIDAKRIWAERVSYGSGQHTVVDYNICYRLSEMDLQAANEWARKKLERWGLCAPPPDVTITDITIISGARAALVYGRPYMLTCTIYGCWVIPNTAADVEYLSRELARSLNINKATAEKILRGELSRDEVETEIALGKLAR